MTIEPHWTGYLSALLVPTIAVLGTVIAYRQWRTAQNKLRLDLFEKRFAVYDVALNFVGTVLANGNVRDEELYKFLVGTKEARWLLNKDVAEYLDAFYKKAVHLQGLNSELQTLPVGSDRSNNVRCQSEIKSWMKRQYDVLDSKFSEFLLLRH